MKKKETTSDYGDFSIPIPLYCNKNSLCVIEFAPSESLLNRNCIRISNLNVDPGFAFENISLKQFKPANISVGLYLTKEEKKVRDALLLFQNLRAQDHFLMLICS